MSRGKHLNDPPRHDLAYAAAAIKQVDPSAFTLLLVNAVQELAGQNKRFVFAAARCSRTRNQAGSLGQLSVRLENGQLAIHYLDGPPRVLPANFRFAFDSGSPDARYVVTAVRVGRRTD